MPDAQPAEERYRSRRQRALERQARRRARAVVFLTGLAAAGLAIWQLPKRMPPLPRDSADGAIALPVARRDTIHAGEDAIVALMRAGLMRDVARSVLVASATKANQNRDVPISLFADSAPAPIREVEFQIADDRSIRVMRIGDSTWTATERHELWRKDTVAVRSAVSGSLVESLRNAGRGTLTLRGRLEAAYELAEAFEYKLDVGRDLTSKDSIVAIVERRRTAFGAEEIGPLLAGAIFHEREWMHAIRFPTPRGTAEYYDVEGRPMRTSFLTAPVEYRRMSSVFGMRFHPVLGILRRHAGIDFAAAPGSPVRAVGDGAVIKAGYFGGFGNLIEIRHRDGMVTRYGHLRGFAPAISEGKIVSLGQVIGFVGSTGLSTGPHLHFETLVNGVSREPTRTLREAKGEPLTGVALSDFALARDAIAGRLGLNSAAAAVLPRLSDGPVPPTPTTVSPIPKSLGTPK